MTYKYADKSERNDFINTTVTVQQDQNQVLVYFKLDKIMTHFISNSNKYIKYIKVYLQAIRHQ